MDIAVNFTGEELVDADNLIGSGNGEEFERDAVEDGEDAGVDADAESDGEDGDEREAGIFGERAGAVAEVLGELFEPDPAPAFAGFFFQRRGISEEAHGGVTGFIFGHSRGDVFGDLLVEMELELVVEETIVLVASGIRIEDEVIFV